MDARYDRKRTAGAYAPADQKYLDKNYPEGRKALLTAIVWLRMERTIQRLGSLG